MGQVCEAKEQASGKGQSCQPSRCTSQTCWAGAGSGPHPPPFPCSAGATPGFLGDVTWGRNGRCPGQNLTGRWLSAPARQDFFQHFSPRPVQHPLLSTTPPFTLPHKDRQGHSGERSLSLQVGQLPARPKSQGDLSFPEEGFSQ